jgi:hypothetical protein
MASTFDAEFLTVTAGNLGTASALDTPLGIGAVRNDATITYWVDQATGSDSNDGLTELTAFATLEHATDLIPLGNANLVTIKVNAGTYNETLNLLSFKIGSQIDIVGQDWTAVTPTTGVSSGTFDGSFTPDPTKHVAVCAGAGWTSGDLRGKFVHITSGANSGAYLPIVDNDADTLWLTMCTVSGASFARVLTSATFDFAIPAAIIGREGSATSLVTMSGSQYSVGNLAPGIRFQNITFDKAAATTGVQCGSGISVAFESCRFLSTGSTSGNLIDATAPTCQVYFKESMGYLGAGGVLCAAGENCKLNFRNAGLYGGQYGIQATSKGLGFVGTFSGVLMGYTTDAFSISGGMLNLSAHLFCRDGATCVRVGGPGTQILLSPTASQTNVYQIDTKSTAGIYFPQNTASTRGHNSLVCYNSVVLTGCTTGVLVETPYTYVDITAASIATNSAWGVNLAGHKTAGFNACQTSSATAMSSNTSGDFTLDGTNAISIAQLRADSDKDVSNLIRFSRLAET